MIKDWIAMAVMFLAGIAIVAEQVSGPNPANDLPFSPVQLPFAIVLGIHWNRGLEKAAEEYRCPVRRQLANIIITLLSWSHPGLPGHPA